LSVRTLGVEYHLRAERFTSAVFPLSRFPLDRDQIADIAAISVFFRHAAKPIPAIATPPLTAKALREDIILGTIEPGAPPRQDHIASHGVSHIPVREVCRPPLCLIEVLSIAPSFPELFAHWPDIPSSLSRPL
jgi:hypothetical protein